MIDSALTRVKTIMTAIYTEGNWTAMEEDAPPIHGTYLVTEDNGNVLVRLWEGEWVSTRKVLAWMPKPAPYEYEGEK